MLKKIFGLLTLFVGAFTLAACEDSVINDWDDIVDRGYIIVGLDETFAPMGFRDVQGELVGFDVDLAKKVFAELDIEVRFQPIDWGSKELELNAGTIDMIWNGLTITPAREEEILFSTPYLANRQVVMDQANNPINALSELSGLSIGVQISSAAESAVNASDIVNDFNELVQYDAYNQAVLDLKNGTIDGVVIDEIAGRYIIALEPNTYRVMTENFGDETYGVGFRLEAVTIRDTVNDMLFDLIQSGEMTSISVEWFAEDILLRP